MAEEEIIGEFEGCGVIKVGVEVRNAGGGLNDALDVDPVLLNIGDTAFVAMRVDVVAIDHKPVKGEEDKLMRVHVMRCTDATIIEADVVSEAVNAQRDRIQKERERREGTQRMFEGNGTGEGDEPHDDDD
jgi:hypothetical protein